MISIDDFVPSSAGLSSTFPRCSTQGRLKPQLRNVRPAAVVSCHSPIPTSTMALYLGTYASDAQCRSSTYTWWLLHTTLWCVPYRYVVSEVVAKIHRRATVHSTSNFWMFVCARGVAFVHWTTFCDILNSACRKDTCIHHSHC
jgi:hypothetical protein